VLEEISMHFMNDRQLISLAGGVGLGAAAMYLLDPVRGTRRRHELADKVVHTGHVVRDGFRTMRRDVRHRTIGVIARARRPFAEDEADDGVIAERVRAEIGRVASHPRAIDVSVTDGCATLSGPILADEADGLLRRVDSVRGVQDVDDRLERHEIPGNVPGLQGPARAMGARFPVLQEDWSPTARLLTGVAGGALAVGGLARGRRGPAGKILTLAGLLLLARGATNKPLGRIARRAPGDIG
jgi:hypothetical protein